MNVRDVNRISFLFERAYPKLLKYAITLTREKSAAHDLVMKSFMKVLEKFKETQELPERLDFYLVKTIRNTFIDGTRRSQFETSIDDTEGYLEPVDPALPSDPLMKKRIIKAFGELSEPCQEMLGLVAQGFTYNEIRDLTERTRNAVAGAIYKCRHNFRIKLFGKNQGEN